MAAIAGYIDDAIRRHQESTLAAYRAWGDAQTQIAAEFDAKLEQLVTWRAKVMAEVDAQYRDSLQAASEVMTAGMVTPAQPAIDGLEA